MKMLNIFVLITIVCALNVVSFIKECNARKQITPALTSTIVSREYIVIFFYLDIFSGFQLHCSTGMCCNLPSHCCKQGTLCCMRRKVSPTVVCKRDRIPNRRLYG